MRFILKKPKRANQSTHIVYNNNQKEQKKKKKKKNSLSQTNPNQLIKFTMNINLSPIHSLVQVNKLHKWEFHIIKKSSISLFPNSPE